MPTKDTAAGTGGDRRLTPTERIHDLAMAAITKTSPRSTGETPTIGQLTSGAGQGRWHCKDLGGNPLAEGETLLEGWAREFEVARQVAADLRTLNSEQAIEDAKLGQS